jgi:hypothetical protein
LGTGRLAFKVRAHIFNSFTLCFQVKSSNNNEYRVKPVFGFIEPGASAALEVIRLPGSAKEDKLVIQVTFTSFGLH